MREFLNIQIINGERNPKSKDATNKTKRGGIFLRIHFYYKSFIKSLGIKSNK